MSLTTLPQNEIKTVQRYRKRSTWNLRQVVSRLRKPLSFKITNFYISFSFAVPVLLSNAQLKLSLLTHLDGGLCCLHATNSWKHIFSSVDLDTPDLLAKLQCSLISTFVIVWQPRFQSLLWAILQRMWKPSMCDITNKQQERRYKNMSSSKTDQRNAE